MRNCSFDDREEDVIIRVSYILGNGLGGLEVAGPGSGFSPVLGFLSAHSSEPTVREWGPSITSYVFFTDSIYCEPEPRRSCPGVGSLCFTNS